VEIVEEVVVGTFEEKEGIVEVGIVEEGIVEEDIVEEGIVEEDIVEVGIVEEGIAEEDIGPKIQFAEEGIAVVGIAEVGIVEELVGTFEAIAEEIVELLLEEKLAPLSRREPDERKLVRFSLPIGAILSLWQDSTQQQQILRFLPTCHHYRHRDERKLSPQRTHFPHSSGVIQTTHSKLLRDNAS